jgi:hypothetical protein
MQAWIDNGMRMGIPNPSVRARTLTFYTDLEPFMRELGINDNSNIHAFLINRDGKILWRTEGPFNGAAFGELVTTLNAQLSAAR